MFHALLILLLLSVIMISLLQRLAMPPLIGYLMTGLAVAPAFSGIIPKIEDMHMMAHLGVVFLLFSIGLEISFDKLISMRTTLLRLGGMQVLLCAVLSYAISMYALNLSPGAALALAGAFTFSSTAVVTKILIERGELQNYYGRNILSVLLFQDLMAVPFLILLPALGSPDSAALGHQMIRIAILGAVVFIAMIVIGRWMLKPLFHQVAASRSSELFMITTLLVALSSGWITEHLELSMELGAFLAGVMLAETEYAHQIEHDIKPFRDILLGLFFISVSMKLSPQALLHSGPQIAILVFAMVVVKSSIIAALAYWVGGIQSKTSIRIGLALGQGGEFGFALIALANQHQVMSSEMQQIVIAASIISLMFTPMLMRKGHIIAEWITREDEEQMAQFDINKQTRSESPLDHILILGFGQVGQTLARFLEQDGFRYIGLDIDPVRISEASAAGDPIFYGDAANENALIQAGLKHARMMIICFDNPPKARRALIHARKHNPEIHSLVITKDDTHLSMLQQSGATEVIPESLEVSLTLASHALLLLGMDAKQVHQQIEDVRTYRYNMLKAYFHGANNTSEENVLHAIKIPQNAYCLQATVGTLSKHLGKVEITRFYRNGFKCAHPSTDVLLIPGDVLVVQGPLKETYQIEEFLIQGPQALGL